MKFSYGGWVNREGVTVYYPYEVRTIDKYKDSMTVYAPPRHIESRGQTLDGPLFTIKLSSPMEGVIRVQAFHFMGGRDLESKFNLNFESPEVVIEENEDFASIKSGSLTAKLNKRAPWSLDFLRGDKKLTSSGQRQMAYINDNGGYFFRDQLNLAVGECVYGLGERFTPFVKNGQVVDMWNEDGGTSSEISYKNIPFYITNRGYGVFVNHSEKVSFEVASEKVEKLQFSVPGEMIDYFVIDGPDMKDVLNRYTRLTGRPALPPAWTFGLWLTTSFTTSYDEGTVSSFIDGMTERNIPLHVFHFDCFWMKEYEWVNFQWDENMFSDPEAMLKRYKDRGLKICVWINSYIGQKSPMFWEGKKNGYLLKRPNGDVWQWDRWQPGMALVDFTNPEACKWYADKLRKLLDMGVDCFKTDFGERIPTDVVYYDGSDPLKMHNYYTFLYNQLVFDVLKEKYGEGNAAVFARSATAGGQQFPVHWGGDSAATYESMAESLRGGLSLCLSGFGFWSHDISGFESTATPDLYKRWVAFGLLSTHSRLHGSSSYRVPWLFDEESVDVLRFFTNLKCKLMPYIFNKSIEANKYGTPVMRAMAMEFGSDPACDYLDRQYMLGDNLLVAPIFEESGDVTYYLPEGTWMNFITGEVIKGGTWRKENHGYMSLPLMVKQNSILPVGNNDQKPDYDYADNVTFHVFGLLDGISASSEVYNTEAALELTLKAERSGNKVTITADGSDKPWSVLLRGLKNVKVHDGASVTVEELGARITPNKGVKSLTIEL